jgi:protoheme IX farnesyltransferase
MRTRLRDYAVLIRPRIAVLVGVTALASASLAGSRDPWLLLHVLLGTLLVTAAASALNQLLERETDGRMTRTRERPLVRGRLSERGVSAFALSAAALGVLELALFASTAAAWIALATLLLYVVVYTPLKRRTTQNTLVGAIAGAAPPVIGWSAARGSLDREALVLFLIVFLWQFPHFLAIAWLNRDDYARAGLKMLPAVEERGATVTRRTVPRYALVLVPASLLPTLAGIAGPAYFFAALVLSLAFLAVALGFSLSESREGARRLLFASIVYLPILFVLMVLDRTNA